MPPTLQRRHQRRIRRRYLTAGLIGLALYLAGCASNETPVALNTAGGDAWTLDKPVTAQVSGDACDSVLFTSPVAAVIARPAHGQASARLPLVPGENLVEAECRKDGARRGAVAQQHWFARIANLPKAWIRVVPEKDGVALDAGASEPAPRHPAPFIRYEWSARPGNPAPLAGLPANGKRIMLSLPAAAGKDVDGEYRVLLRVTDAAGRSDESTAMFCAANGRIEPVDLARGHPAWVDRAVVYGVLPFLFGAGRFPDVTARLDELAALGVTALWLSPITATTEDDFGYGSTDYFRLRADFGSAAELRDLIGAAHARKMRVIMDVPPNHVSSEHPYFKDAEAGGTASPYYAFFDRDASGRASHYFTWTNLINLNYDNPEVQQWVIAAFAHWLRAFDVDGFRVDAAWGPRQRAPEFWSRWRRELKRIKPDLLLLAEASARDPYYFRNGFDAAYDWTGELGHWAWRPAFDDEAHTARLLRAAIAASQEAPDALVFRFLNNNDTGQRFITRYGLPRTRLASAMLLTLPGLPQIHTGEEIGAAFRPYEEGPPLTWGDPYDLRPWYTRLIALRAGHAALRSNGVRFLALEPFDQLLAYVRPGRAAKDGVLVLLNWSARPLKLDLPLAVLGDMEVRGGMVDLIGGQHVRADAVHETLPVSLPAHGVRFLSVP
ncbi:MAG TPA: alpha-amylase family glycosyl hydrolase [Ferrovibrio sp.]|uniref:alpha-amylase family glycosyl hydrolase n=1 Tax=Ferrovibrio sp. TaxID=1917215 RepID=UPI002ED30359